MITRSMPRPSPSTEPTRSTHSSALAHTIASPTRSSTLTTEGTCNCKMREQAKNQGVISAIGMSLNYDTTGSKPAALAMAISSRLEQELAGFGGDHTFMGFAYLNTYYKGNWEDGLFKFRADMRFIVPLFDTKQNTHSYRRTSIPRRRKHDPRLQTVPPWTAV